MSQVILSVPVSPDVKKRMDQHREIKWVEVARSAVVEKLDILEKLDKMLSKSTLTEEDAVRIGREINKKVFQHYASG